MLVGMKTAASWLRLKAERLLSDEKGEVNIVAIIVLIGIAVLLAIIFKDQISALIKNLLNTISGKANNAVSN